MQLIKIHMNDNYFRIDSFNESGVTEGKQIKVARANQ